MTDTTQLVIQQTKNWISEIVIGLNLCPFASRPFNDNRIEYIVNTSNSIEQHLHQLADCFTTLDDTTDVETSLLILPDAYPEFDDYLELVDLANHLLEELNYSGIYQLASFHPDYRFDGSTEKDASNFSNRSPYPMLHLIRENSIEKAIDCYKDIESVPENNIKKLQQIGYSELQQTLKNILNKQ